MSDEDDAIDGSTQRHYRTTTMMMNSQQQPQRQQQAAAAAALKALDQSMQQVLHTHVNNANNANNAALVSFSAPYRHVRQYAPHLLLTESADFLVGVRQQEGERGGEKRGKRSSTTMMKLLRYWHVRAQLFVGQQPQPQPLLLLQKPLLECLTPDDVACLRMGHVVVMMDDETNNNTNTAAAEKLPPPPILYLDVTRLTTTTTATSGVVSRQTRLRSVLVVLQHFFLQQQQQKQQRQRSFVGLVYLDQHAFLDHVVQEWVDWLYEFFPVQAEKIVFIGMDKSDDKDDDDDGTNDDATTAATTTTTTTPLWWNAHILPRALKVCGKLLERSDDPEVKVHFCGGNAAANANASSMARQLLEQEYGFPSHCIPERLGGTWTYQEKWNTWVDGLVVEKNNSNSNNMSLLEGRRSQEHETDDTAHGVQMVAAAAAAAVEENGARKDVQQEPIMPNNNDNTNQHPHHQEPRQGVNVTQSTTATAYYWKVRKDLFGEERYKLPLTQTGEGPLSRQDLACLKTGAWMMLPKDRQGRIVLFCDPSRATHDEYCLLRCAFYFVSLVRESCCTSRCGLVVLCALTDTIIGNVRQGLCLGDILKAHSVQLQALHCVLVPGGKDHGDSLWLQTRVDAARRFFGLLLVQQQRLVVVHAAPTQMDLIRRLEIHWLSQDGLPSSLGGCFGYEQFAQWQELRIRVEWGLPLGSTMTRSSKQVMDMFGVDSFCAKPLLELTADEKEERQRRMNILHARRKRERERVEIECTKEKCAKLQDCNMRLAQENAQLEVMLNQVKDQIPDWEELCASALARKECERDEQQVNHPTLSPLEEQKQHKREMNRLYSQRKRDRERLQIETLTKQCDELKASNTVISRENQWMEERIQSVMQQVSLFEKRSVTERANAGDLLFYPGSPA